MFIFGVAEIYLRNLEVHHMVTLLSERDATDRVGNENGIDLASCGAAPKDRTGSNIPKKSTYG